MKNAIIGGMLLVFVLATGIVLHTQSQLQQFTSDDGSFSVEFPGMPSVEHETETTGLLTITSTTYTARPYMGLQGSLYAVAYSDFPAVNTAGASKDYILRKALEGFRRGVKDKAGIILKETPITMAGFPAFELEVERGDKESTLIMFLDGFRVYVLEVTHGKGKDYSA